MDSQATQIVKWAEQQTKPAAPTPAYKRLTDDQRIAILHLDKVGKTQVEIAHTLGCDQTTVGRWLRQCQDSTLEASTYLKGSALRMARNVVSRGQARDHIQALKGIGVLENDKTELNLAIGVSLSGMPSESSPVIQGQVVSPQPPKD